MKKLSMIEAAAIVGGTSTDTCVSSYQQIAVGGVGTCKEVITCTDKHGNASVTTKDVSTTMCRGTNF